MTLDGEVFDALVLASGLADKPILGADIVCDVPGGVPALVGVNALAPIIAIRSIDVSYHNRDRRLIDRRVSKKIGIWQRWSMKSRMKTIDLSLRSGSRSLHDDTPGPYLDVADDHDLPV